MGETAPFITDRVAEEVINERLSLREEGLLKIRMMLPWQQRKLEDYVGIASLLTTGIVGEVIVEHYEKERTIGDIAILKTYNRHF